MHFVRWATLTRGGGNMNLFLVALAVLGCANLACTDGRTPPIRADSAATIEPHVKCLDSGRTIGLDIEVIPELHLTGVTGLPADSTTSPQLILSFHLTKIRELRRDVDIEMYISAESSLGRLPVGSARIARVHPQPRLWQMDSCFPVACDISLPLAMISITWHLEARIRNVAGKAIVVSLGDVCLLADGAQ